MYLLLLIQLVHGICLCSNCSIFFPSRNCYGDNMLVSDDWHGDNKHRCWKTAWSFNVRVIHPVVRCFHILLYFVSNLRIGTVKFTVIFHLFHISRSVNKWKYVVIFLLGNTLTCVVLAVLVNINDRRKVRFVVQIILCFFFPFILFGLYPHELERYISYPYIEEWK